MTAKYIYMKTYIWFSTIWKYINLLPPFVFLCLTSKHCLRLCIMKVILDIVLWKYIYDENFSNFYWENIYIYFITTWNLLSLLGLVSLFHFSFQVPIFSQAPLLVLDYRWSHNLATYRRAVIPNYYRTHTVPKFGL